MGDEPQATGAEGARKTVEKQRLGHKTQKITCTCICVDTCTVGTYTSKHIFYVCICVHGCMQAMYSHALYTLNMLHRYVYLCTHAEYMHISQVIYVNIYVKCI